MFRSILAISIFLGSIFFTAFGAQPVSLSSMTLNTSITTAEMSTVEVLGQEFTEAERVYVPQKTENIYNIQCWKSINTTLNVNDAVLVEFFVRSATAQECEFTFRVEQTVSPWTGSAHRNITAGSDWKKVLIPFLVQTEAGSASYALGEAAMRFQLGVKEQTLEIGGVSALNFGQIALDSLELLAAGERDTSWRSEAYANIEKVRKGDFAIRVVDGDGSPVSGAALKVVMKGHDFFFGGLTEDLILSSGTDAEKFRASLLELFNGVTQRIYWAWNWNSPANIQKVMKTIDWAEQNGLRSRGHTVVYPTWQFSPSWLLKYQDNQQVLFDTVSAHVVECAKALDGRLEDWDVVNESFHYYDQVIEAAGGLPSLASWYTLAKNNAPGIAPYVNEYDIIGNGGTSHSREGYKAQIQYLLDNGVPLEGIGMQGHTDSYIEPKALKAILDDFSQFGLPIRVTEMDVNVNNEKLQASDLYDYMLTIFSHPQTVGLSLWGHWEGNMWNDRKGLIRQDWSIKPSAQIWKEMIFTKWWTPEQNLTSGSDGFCGFRGFKGSYEVSTVVDGITRALQVNLTDSIDTATVSLEDFVVGVKAPKETRAGAVSFVFRGMTVAQFNGNNKAGELQIIDLRGKVIRSITVDGQKRIFWDGRDREGKGVCEGSYVVRFRSRAGAESRRVMLMKK